MTKTRKTIGVMVGGITDDFTRFLCKGLREAAKEQDVNMVVLPGKFLDRDYAQNTDIMYISMIPCFRVYKKAVWTGLS